MPRKTINLKEFVEANNRFLAAPSSTREQRIGVAIAVEHALGMANAYAGFQYLDTEFCKNGDAPLYADTPTGLRKNYDDTRRRYFVKA